MIFKVFNAAVEDLFNSGTLFEKQSPLLKLEINGERFETVKQASGGTSSKFPEAFEVNVEYPFTAVMINAEVFNQKGGRSATLTGIGKGSININVQPQFNTPEEYIIQLEVCNEKGNTRQQGKLIFCGMLVSSDSPTATGMSVDMVDYSQDFESASVGGGPYTDEFEAFESDGNSMLLLGNPVEGSNGIIDGENNAFPFHDGMLGQYLEEDNDSYFLDCFGGSSDNRNEVEHDGAANQYGDFLHGLQRISECESESNQYTDSEDKGDAAPKKKGRKLKKQKNESIKKMDGAERPRTGPPQSGTTNDSENISSNPPDAKSEERPSRHPKRFPAAICASPPNLHMGSVQSAVSAKHSSAILQKELNIALRKIKAYAAENTSLRQRLDKSKIQHEFENMKAVITEQDIEIDHLKSENKSMRLVTNNQKKQLLSAQARVVKQSLMQDHSLQASTQAAQATITAEEKNQLIVVVERVRRQQNILNMYRSNEKKMLGKIKDQNKENVKLKNEIKKLTGGVTRPEGSVDNNSKLVAASPTVTQQQTETILQLKNAIEKLKQIIERQRLSCDRELSTMRATLVHSQESRKQLEQELGMQETRVKQQVVIVKSLKQTCEELAEGNQRLLTASDVYSSQHHQFSSIGYSSASQYPSQYTSMPVYVEPRPPSSAPPPHTRRNKPKASIMCESEDEENEQFPCRRTDNYDKNTTFLTT